MPLDIECQLIAGLVIRQIKHLLENKRAQDGMQFLGGTAEILFKKRVQTADRQIGKDFILKQPRPRLVEQLPSLAAEKAPGIKKIELFVVFNANHAFSL